MIAETPRPELSHARRALCLASAPCYNDRVTRPDSFIMLGVDVLGAAARDDVTVRTG